LTSGIEVENMQTDPTVAIPVGQPPFSIMATVGNRVTLRHHETSTKKVLAFMSLCERRSACI
jgi:hypothetical protein